MELCGWWAMMMVVMGAGVGGFLALFCLVDIDNVNHYCTKAASSCKFVCILAIQVLSGQLLQLENPYHSPRNTPRRSSQVLRDYVRRYEIDCCTAAAIELFLVLYICQRHEQTIR